LGTWVLINETWYKVALQAAKARGMKLGNPKRVEAMRSHVDRGRQLSIEARQAGTKERAQQLQSVFRDFEARGIPSANALAKALDEEGILTVRGGSGRLAA
jgi:hypothetical protein